jgi:hypothetical protein
MRIPTIHLNGTPQKKLFEDACEAMGKIRTAIDALHAMRPHGRDYYPQSDDALTDALHEHESRVRRLRVVLAELEQIAEGITDQAWSAPPPPLPTVTLGIPYAMWVEDNYGRLRVKICPVCQEHITERIEHDGKCPRYTTHFEEKHPAHAGVVTSQPEAPSSEISAAVEDRFNALMNPKA